jgi:hypothetical protein
LVLCFRLIAEEEDDWREPARETRSPPSWSPQRVATPASDLSLPRPRRVYPAAHVEEPAIKPHRVPSFLDKEAPVKRRSKNPELRQRSPSPLSPRERFKVRFITDIGYLAVFFFGTTQQMLYKI